MRAAPHCPKASAATLRFVIGALLAGIAVPVSAQPNRPAAAAATWAGQPVIETIRFTNTSVILNGYTHVAGFMLQVPTPAAYDVYEIHWGDGAVDRWDGKRLQVHSYQLPAGTRRQFTAFVLHFVREGAALLPRGRSGDVTLTLTAPPLALALSAQPDRATAGEVINFRANLVGLVEDGPREYLFSPGDGSAAIRSARPEFKYIYPAGGSFVARVELVGTKAAAEKMLRIAAAPELILTASTAHANAGQPVTLRVRYDAPATGLAYRFTVPGEFVETTASRTLVHTFAESGRKRVIAEVGPAEKGPDGRLALARALTTSRELVLEIAAPPELRLSPATVAIERGDAVRFRVGMSDGSSVGPFTFDPGDGSGRRTQLEPEIEHTYSRAGRFVATAATEAATAESRLTVNRTSWIHRQLAPGGALRRAGPWALGALALAIIAAAGIGLRERLFPQPRLKVRLRPDTHPTINPAARRIGVQAEAHLRIRRVPGRVRIVQAAEELVRSDSVSHGR